jgi:hypothetical protein
MDSRELQFSQSVDSNHCIEFKETFERAPMLSFHPKILWMIEIIRF